MRSLAGLLALLAVAGPLAVHFAWQRDIATIGDDSVSYLLLARHFAGTAGPLLAPWVPYQAHFPPLFPLALAAAGGATSLLAAHLLVAAFGLAAAVAIQRYGALRLGGEVAGLALAAGFLLTPTAWVSIKGILSEPMYLLLSILALDFHAARLEARRDAPWTAWLALGGLAGAAVLTRAAGVALLAALAAHGALRAVRKVDRRAWVPFLALVPPALLAGLWLALRPVAGTNGYAGTGEEVLATWARDPGLALSLASRYFLDGWIASFTADPAVPAALRAVFALLGVLGLAGAVRAALGNRLDGWYVLATLALVLAWVFPAENMRRLLYPVVPLLLLHAAQTAFALARRRAAGRHGARIAGAVLALPALLCVPAWVLVQEKSLDRTPPAGADAAYADVTDYYGTLNVQRARALAAKQVAVLTGFGALASRTPPQARVMWMRPEYVALLGGRAGVPFYYGWDARRLAGEIRRAGVDYVVMSRLFKSDLAGHQGDPFATLASVGEYAEPVFAVPNAAVGGEEFVLMRVDRGRLEGFLARDRES
ncbi:MAG TPA: hypothetical protein VEG27_06335 [Usitatibacter sp.]|nr:hypothetical protein [Usitatibacter sp.]